MHVRGWTPETGSACVQLPTFTRVRVYGVSRSQREQGRPRPGLAPPLPTVGGDNAFSPYNKANIFVSYGSVHSSLLHNEYKHDYGREGSLQGSL